MKRLIAFLIVLAVAAPALAAVKTLRLSVTGWTCGSCATASRIALRKLEGVEEVTTDARKGEAVVRYDDARVGPEQMAAALRRLGYTAVVRKEPAPASASSGPVTFFQVPLGCPAVKNLGCGSLSLPILEKLEVNPKVAGAWLDHSGSVLAVVWKSEALRAADEVQRAFRESELEAAPLSGARAEAARKSFARRDRWYRGSDVHDLSREEARVLAARLAGPVEAEMPPAKFTAMRSEFAAQFEKCFVGGLQLVAEDFAKIARKYVDQTAIDKMETAWWSCREDESELQQK